MIDSKFPKEIKSFCALEAMRDINKVRRRDGGKIMQMFIAKQAKLNSQIIIVNENGTIDWRYLNGQMFNGQIHDGDLFLIDDTYKGNFIEIKNSTLTFSDGLDGLTSLPDGTYELVKIK